MKVLLTDDDATLVEAVSHHMRQAGWKVTTASCGKQALSSVADERPDIIFLDVSMSGMDGFEVCRRLKDNPATRAIPVALMTGLPRMEHRLRAIAASADSMAAKPPDGDVLMARARSLTRATREGTETIVLVEGEPETRAAAWALLALYRYRVLAAGSGQEALEILRGYKGVVHLVLMDAALPDMDCREVVQRVVQQRPLVRILYTSWCSHRAAARFVTPASGLTLLDKPFLWAELLCGVRDTLDER